MLAKADEDGIDISAAEEAMDTEAEEFDAAVAVNELNAIMANYSDKSMEIHYELEDEETLEVTEETATLEDVDGAIEMFEKYEGGVDPANYGVWVPGVPVLVEGLLDKIGCADWLKSLILDGIIAGVGAVLGFVPQMLVLFFLLAFVEACGYMARIAFVLDRGQPECGPYSRYPYGIQYRM